MEDFINRLRKTRVLPVIEIDDAVSAAPLVKALSDGGMTAIEIALRTPAAVDAILAAKRARPDVLVGAGTVVDGERARRAIAGGADFLVTPGSTRELLVELAGFNKPLLPGVATPSEAIAARALGLKLMKFFPAEPAGGAAYVGALAAPLPDVLFCPTGGIGVEEAPNYLRLKNVICVGGSWVAPRAAIAAKDWRAIAANARRAAALA